jgi:hypothetical protein
MARRTARQRAASKRNLIKARRARKPMSRKKKILVGAAILGTGATGVYAVDRTRNVRLYHNTSYKAANKIIKQGFIGGEPRGSGPATYFSVGRNETKAFGNATVKAKVRQKQFRKIAHRDYEEGGSTYYINSENRHHIKNIRIDHGRKVYRGVTQKGRRVKTKYRNSPVHPRKIRARRRVRKMGYR